MNRISFIVSAYNVEAYIEACLRSLAAQKTGDMEVIVVDDGSTDQSGDICERFAENDSRFRVIHKDNGGPASARNLGLRNAVGEWICFVDGDDMVEENFMGNLNWQEYQDSDVVFFRFSYLDASGTIQKQPNDGISGKLNEETRSEIMKVFFNADFMKADGSIPNAISVMQPWAKLYRRKFLLDHGLSFPETLESFGEDACFNMMMYQCRPGLYVESLYLYIYRYTNTSLIHGYKDNIIDSVNTFYKTLSEIILSDAETGKELEKYLPLRAVRNFLHCCAMNFFHPDNPKTRRQRKKDFMSLRGQPVYQDAFKRANLSLLRLSVRAGALFCKYRLFNLYEIAWKIANRMGVRHA